MPWKQKLLQLTASVDGALDNAKHLLKKRLGTNEKIQVVPFRSYGTANRIYCRGRLMEDSGIKKSETTDSRWQNLVNMYRRFETDELPGEKITLLLQDKIYHAITDHEGYFVFDIVPPQAIVSDALYFELPLAAAYNGQQAAAIAEIMIPPVSAEYGIISDIDDTIIQTGATSITGMLKTVLLTNASTRLPFEGVTDLYKSLQKGRNGITNNPFFYVSNSPWNLYDLITDFMDMQDLPQGPLLLRDFGIRSETFVNHDYLGHKFKEIKQVLETYPLLNFVLIGDSGEEDPVIYHEVVKHFPGRILAVYIRDVNNEVKRTIAIEVSKKIEALGVEMMLTGSSVKAMGHAVVKRIDQIEYWINWL